MVLRFSTRHFSAASLVMKLMNSETHSWTHSLASFEILAVAGTLDFIILATFAILRTRQWQAWAGRGWRVRKNRRGMSRHTHRQETILFSVLPDFLVRYRRRFWSIWGRFRRGAGTVTERGDIWIRCVLCRHNSLDGTLELTCTLPHRLGTSGTPGATIQPSLIESLLDRLRVIFHQAPLPS